MRSQSVETMKKWLNWKLSTLHLYITNRTHTTQNWRFLTKTNFLDVVFILTFTYSRKDLLFSWTNMKKKCQKIWILGCSFVDGQKLSKRKPFSMGKRHQEYHFLNSKKTSRKIFLGGQYIPRISCYLTIIVHRVIVPPKPKQTSYPFYILPSSKKLHLNLE